jgi:hypothetical protein
MTRSDAHSLIKNTPSLKGAIAISAAQLAHFTEELLDWSWLRNRILLIYSDSLPPLVLVPMAEDETSFS